MPAKRRRPGRARPSWWTCTALAAGAALLLTGGFLQLRTSDAEPARPGNPVKLLVPTLGVSARVLGIRVRDGALIPPSNPRLVGWWSDGAQPGASKGSAV